jgi:hypothetical protein
MRSHEEKEKRKRKKGIYFTNCGGGLVNRGHTVADHRPARGLSLTVYTYYNTWRGR